MVESEIGLKIFIPEFCLTDYLRDLKIADFLECCDP
jgi:hypothetical protein